MMSSRFPLLFATLLLALGGCATTAHPPAARVLYTGVQSSLPFPGTYSKLTHLGSYWNQTYTQDPPMAKVSAQAFFEDTGPADPNSANTGGGKVGMFDVSDRAILVEGDFSAYGMVDGKAVPVRWPIIIVGPVRTGAEGTEFAVTPGVKDPQNYYVFLLDNPTGKGVIAATSAAPSAHPAADTSITLTNPSATPDVYGYAYQDGSNAWLIKKMTSATEFSKDAYQRVMKLHDAAHPKPDQKSP